MGGDLKRDKTMICKDWKRKEKEWNRLTKDSAMSYLVQLHSCDTKFAIIFILVWYNDTTTQFGKEFPLDEKLISQISRISMGGMNFYKESKILESVINKFPKTNQEREDMVKCNSTFFDPKQNKPIWNEVFKPIMEYFSINGRYTRIHDYHLTLLNDFRDKILVSFLYFLLS